MRDGIRRACVEPPGRSQGESQANRSATSALIRARSLRAKEIPAERVQAHGVCGRHGGTEERLTWGDLVVFPRMVFMPQLGPKSRRGRSSYKATPKCLIGAQREVRDLVVATTCRESGTTRVMAAREGRLGESVAAGCEGGPQEWEPGSDAMLSTEPEAR